MKVKTIAVVKYILVLGIGIGMLWLAFKGVSLENTIHEIAKANFFWLAVSIFVSLIAFYSRALRWNMLIEPLGYKPSPMNTSASLMIGYLANLAVPRLGEVTRCGSLSNAEKIPFDSLLGTVIIERIIDVICLLLLIVLVAILEFERLGNFLNDNIYIPLTNKLSVIYNHPFITLTIAIALAGLIYFLLKRNNKAGGITEKISKLAKGVLGGIDTVRKLKNPVGFILHTILIWTMYFLMSYLCFFSLEATAHLSWEAGLFVLVVGGMGMSAPVQGGIGAYHLLVSQGLVLYGVTPEHGITFATLMHTSQTVVVIVLGGFSFLYLFLKKRNATEIKHT